MITLLALGLSPTFAAPPATVLEHRVDVTVDSSRRLSEDVLWTVRIDDPAACTAGLIAPPGLDGAMDGGALVLEELLVVPNDVSAGTVFTLRTNRKLDRAEHSGIFLTAPDLATEQASITVNIPLSQPLTVWADDLALPTFETKRSRKVTFSWTDLPPGTVAQAAWSTHTDWFEAGENIRSAVEGKLANKDALGREHAAGIEGLGVAGIAEKAFRAVTLEQGPTGSWVSARPARDTLDAKSGTAADRGVVLMSMLKLAGFEAIPAYYRPAGVYGVLPVSVPAPTLLPRPLVVVRRKDGDVFIDPAADRVAIPDRPASLLGATVWVPGELPTHLPEIGVVDGAVAINSSMQLDGDGGATYHVAVQATGAAQEYLRNLLAPLDEAGRTEAFARLVRQGHPQTTSLLANISGAEKATKPLKISISGRDLGVLGEVPYGLRGNIAPLLAPALAAWLPPRIRIIESIQITPPTTVQILGISTPESLFHPEALVGRTVKWEGRQITLTSEVERPYRATTPAMEERATAFLAEQAPLGADVLLFTTASGSTAKAVRTAPELSPGDRAVLEALLWFSTDNRGKAEKTLAKASPTVGFEALVAGLTHWADPKDLRPWMALLQVADENDVQRVQVMEGLEKAGARRDAWELGLQLRASPDPDVRVRALLAVERLQGPEPDPEVDPDAATAWVEPMELIVDAQRAATEISSAPDPRVVFRLAELSIERGDVAGTEALLEKVDRTGLAEVLLADAAAVGGVPRDEVRERVEAAVARDPKDPLVVSIAADALGRVGDAEGAQHHAITAARLAHRDPELWALAVEKSLQAGDLLTAVEAARRASDLDPQSKSRAMRWATLATAALDRDGVDAARMRASLPPIASWPPGIDERIALDPSAMLAVLQLADHEVVAEPRLLSMRAQMRIDQDMLDEAARDGLVLATVHGVTEGWALTFASTAGRQYSTVALKQLDQAAKTELTAQVTRMEVRLISGSGDPAEDARRLDDPRARAVLQTVSDPKGVAALVEGWTPDLPTPSNKPPATGFKLNKYLSGPGYVGFSNPEAAVAVVHVGGVTGLLPPPLGAMYTTRSQAVQRIEDGGQILRLEGGVVPLYAAFVVRDGEEWIGLGFTAAAAHQAIRSTAP
ncbi:MAG: hypothetical protein H6738_06670 [Alphaproteobacteria bacterium]|nr:hypothetical protein [Alphaproteobacteria bacterium]MCB9696445.1 hypothetical protein [Alphaproteobacteria bacterium]